MSTRPHDGLRAVDLAHRFGHVTALRGVSLAVEAGSVTCLLGDNGAGKSTALRILAGALSPDSGHLSLDGEVLRLASPRDARDRGIATVYQDLALVPLMAVWRNFFLAAEPTTGRGPLRRIDVASARAIARTEIGTLGIDIGDPDRPASTLSGGERQALAIARAAFFGARFLILDEPTAALALNQAAAVLRFVRAAADRGLGVLLVTHNPRHAYEVGDRFVILRHGLVVARHHRRDLDADGLVRLMAGGVEPGGAT